MSPGSDLRAPTARVAVVEHPALQAEMIHRGALGVGIAEVT
jgi:hypothetical protein